MPDKISNSQFQRESASGPYREFKHHLNLFKVLWFVITISCLSLRGENRSSQPPQIRNIPEIESGTVLYDEIGVIQIVSTNSDLYNSTYELNYPLTFKTPKTQNVSVSNIFYAVPGIFMHDRNYQTSNSSLDHVIFFEIDTTLRTSTSLVFEVERSLNIVLRCTISYIIIDEIFQNEAFIRQPKKKFDYNTHTHTIDYDYFGGTPIVTPFLKKAKLYGDLGTLDFAVGVNITLGTASALLQGFAGHPDQPTMTSLFQSTNTECWFKFLVIYHYKFQPQGRYEFHIQYQKIVSPSSGSSDLNLTVNPYVSGRTHLLTGIAAFDYSARNPSLSFFRIDFSNNSTTSLDTSPQVLSYMEFYDFHQLDINLVYFSYWDCPVDHPIKEIDALNFEIVNCWDQCDHNEYMSLDPNNDYVCTPCDDECVACDNSYNCTQCRNGFELNQTGQCVLMPTFFIASYDAQMMAVVDLCEQALPNCQNCNPSGATCYACKRGFDMTASNLCEPCPIPNCQQCESGLCTSCMTGYLASANNCIQDSVSASDLTHSPPSQPSSVTCSDSQNCKTCSSSNPDQCYECFDLNMTIYEGVCQVFCGDGKLYEGVQECDNNNQFSFDGCSSNCQLQKDFKCTNYQYLSNSNTFVRSTCRFQHSIQFSLKSIFKQPHQNTVNIELSNPYPKIFAWLNIRRRNLSEAIQVSIQNSSDYKIQTEFRLGSQYEEVGNTGTVTIQDYHRLLSEVKTDLFTAQMMQEEFSTIHMQLFYSLQEGKDVSEHSLDNNLLRLDFDPKNTSTWLFSTTPSTLLQFQLVSSNNVPITYSDENYYTLAEFTQVLATLISVLALMMFLLSLLVGFFQKGSKSPLIAVEYAFSVQSAYFTIYIFERLNPIFYSLADGLKYSSALGVNFSSTQGSEVESKLLGIGLESSSFFGNYLIAFMVVLTSLVIGGMLKILQRVKWLEKPRIANYFLGTLTYLTVCYFAQSLFFCLSVCIKSKTQIETQDILLAAISLVIFLLTALALLFKGQWYSDLILNFQNTDEKNTPQIKNLNSENCQQENGGSFEQNTSQAGHKAQCSSNQKSAALNFKFYLLWAFLERPIWMMAVVFLSPYMASSIIALLTSSLFVFLCAFKFKFIYRANKFRCIFNSVSLIIVQLIFTVQYYELRAVYGDGKESGKQSTLSQYMAFSILGILFVQALLAIAYFVYSIKALRCCVLQIEWNKQTQSQPLVQELESRKSSASELVNTNRNNEPQKKKFECKHKEMISSQSSQQDESERREIQNCKQFEIWQQLKKEKRSTDYTIHQQNRCSGKKNQNSQSRELKGAAYSYTNVHAYLIDEEFDKI